MKYIKENFVFSMLTLILLALISVLILRMLVTSPSDASSTPKDKIKNTDIKDFSVSFDRQLKLHFNWDIMLGNESIESMSILYLDTIVEDVTAKTSFELVLLDTTFPTGNLEFRFEVTLSNQKVLQKRVFVYINEAFGFNVEEQQDGNRITYEVTYYYKKGDDWKAPKVQVQSSGMDAIQINYEDSKIISNLNGFIQQKDRYTLDASNFKQGTHSLHFKWLFEGFNVEYDTTSTIDV